jgi:hypothetical protein
MRPIIFRSAAILVTGMMWRLCLKVLLYRAAAQNPVFQIFSEASRYSGNAAEPYQV